MKKVTEMLFPSCTEAAAKRSSEIVVASVSDAGITAAALPFCVGAQLTSLAHFTTPYPAALASVQSAAGKVAHCARPGRAAASDDLGHQEAQSVQNTAYLGGHYDRHLTNNYAAVGVTRAAGPRKNHWVACADTGLGVPS